MKNIKNIIFDFGVVLINLERDKFISNFKALGVSEIENLTSTAVHKGVFAQFETGLISESQFYDEIRKLSDKMISDSQIKDAWLSMTTDIPTYKLDKILELKKDYNVFLLSNTNILHWQKAKNYEFSKRGFSVEDYFHKIWLSYEINLMKPSDEIFEFILKDSGMNPEQTLLIDDAEMNCQTAEKFGIKTYMPTHKEDWRHIFETENILQK